MKKLSFKIIFISLLLSLSLEAKIQIIKKTNNDSNTTLLVISGIHGNEPGSYFAGGILATHYDIKTKNVWIVPNLNKQSIIANQRGIHGDMNRKFATIKKGDKDSQIVKDIKKLILSKNISLVLNLHDGHGFYRQDFQGNIFNPNAWGQTCVIDQCKLKENQPFGNLNEIAKKVKNSINSRLINSHHSFNVKNTKTKFDDEDMQLSLTYFSVTHSKPAFAIESSKNLSSLSQKVYYQLLAIEEFMDIMDIKYERDFEINEKEISKILKEYGRVDINENISFNLSNIKSRLNYIPLKSKNNIFSFTHPLGGVKKQNGLYKIYIGNKLITSLKPQYFKIANQCPTKIDVEIDNSLKSFDTTQEIVAKRSFKIIKDEDIRVNIIGFTKAGVDDESGIKITKKELTKKFSIDKKNTTYRVEFYKKNNFCSMSTIRFQ
jgi:hypothetical protein